MLDQTGSLRNITASGSPLKKHTQVISAGEAFTPFSRIEIQVRCSHFFFALTCNPDLCNHVAQTHAEKYLHGFRACISLPEKRIYSSCRSRTTFGALNIPYPDLRRHNREIIKQGFPGDEDTRGDVLWISGFVSHK